MKVKNMIEALQWYADRHRPEDYLSDYGDRARAALEAIAADAVTAEQLCMEWIEDERQRRARWAEFLLQSQTPEPGKPLSYSRAYQLGYADALQSCRRSVQESFHLVLSPEEVSELVRASADGASPDLPTVSRD